MAAPKMLMLDEPSLGLAPLLVKEIFENVATINRELGLPDDEPTKALFEFLDEVLAKQ